MDKIIFWLFVIVVIVWMYESIKALIKNEGFAKKFMIIPSLLLLSTAVYFFINPNISKFHLLWVAPTIIIGEMLFTSIIVRIFKRGQ